MTPVDLIPLSKAVYCVDCDRVSASTKTCVGCGSIAILSLSKVLNRSELDPSSSAIEDLMAMVERQMKGMTL
jgi:hypothetical protein